MHIYQVGQPYSPGKTFFTADANYNFRRGEHDLLLSFDELSANEIEDIQRGDSRFAFLVYERLIFFLYKFGESVHWSDCPFSIWLVPEEDRIAPVQDFTINSRALIHVTLVRAETNIIEALRVVSLSPTFTRELHLEIAKQMREPLDDSDYQRAIDAAFARWPKSKDMLPFAQCSCRGEE